MRSRCTWSPRSNCLRALTRQSDAIVGHQTARRFCPTGKSLPACRNRLSTPSCKNISLHPDGQIRGITPPVSPKRGAGRDRHERGLRCGGRGSVGAQEVVAGRVSRERSASAQTNGAKARKACWRRRVAAYGEGVWFWYPLLMSSLRRCVGPTGLGQVSIRRRR